MTLRRRLVAALAAASLVLGGAVAAAPAVAAPGDPEPAPVIALEPDEDTTVEQPATTIFHAVRLTYDGVFDLPDESRAALKITLPEGVPLSYAEGHCEAFARAGSTETYPIDEIDAFQSGDECIVTGDITTEPRTPVLRFTSAAWDRDAEDVPPPVDITFEVERTVVLDESGSIIEETVLPDPHSTSTLTIVTEPPFVGQTGGPQIVWMDEDSIDFEFTLHLPDPSFSPAVVAAEEIRSAWTIDWPEYTSPIAVDSPGLDACTNLTASTDGFCSVDTVQEFGCPDAHCEGDGDDGTPGPAPEFCSDGYCYFELSFSFAIPDTLDTSSVTGDFSLSPGEVVIENFDGGTRTAPVTWAVGDSVTTSVVADLFLTDVLLSAANGAVDGADVTATFVLEQIDDVDVLAGYEGFGDEIWFELVVELDWPEFLEPVGPPIGCDTWIEATHLCYMTIRNSPPGVRRDVTLTLAMPDSLPDPAIDEFTMRAESVEIWGNGEGEGVVETVPTDVVAQIEVPFEVYEPILGTSVELSASAGSPGGEDVVATFTVSRLPESDYEFITGTVELRITWPEFLKPVGVPAGCEGFPAEPPGSEATCTISGVEPDVPASFELAFSMPADSTDEPRAGDFTIEGVVFTATLSGEPDTVIETYDERFIVPDSAPFVVDSEVFSVEVTLDRSVSTPGGLRLYASFLVTYEHEMSDVQNRPNVGITLGWPEFLTVTDLPGVVGCDELVGSTCYLEQMWEEGDSQRVEIWFDMPEAGSGIGLISATAQSLCTGRREYFCPPLPVAWVGSDAEEFRVLDPRIDVDVVVDRDTGWTGGKPITATATITHTSTIPGILPGLEVDLLLDWPEQFLTPTSISGCDEMLAGAICRLTELDTVSSKETLSIVFGMPPAEDLRFIPPDPPKRTAYPKTGQVIVSGAGWSYIAAAPTPLPCGPPGGPTPTASPTPTPTPTSTSTPSPLPTCEPEPEPAPTVTATASPSSSPSESPTLNSAPPDAGIASIGQSVEDLTSSSLTPEDLVDEIVGSGVTTSNVDFIGDLSAAGLFSGFDDVGFSSGVILSTGDVATAPGPNESESETSYWESFGDADLDAISGEETLDASVLEFDFVPTSSQVFVDFVFASEEYDEYASLEEHDVFAVFVNGANCALTPDGARVSTTTINGGTPPGTGAQRPELYRDNGPEFEDGDPPLPLGSPLDLEADGLTTVLRCIAPVTANDTNTMKIAIADSSDGEVDSQLFIAADSVRSNRPPVAVDRSVTTEVDAPVDVLLLASDLDADVLTYEVVVPPSHGTLSGSSLNLIYTPAAGYVGPDSFTYRASDGVDTSNTATVSIAVEREDTEPPPPPPPPGDPVVVELPVEWIGSDSVRVAVLQPKVTVTPFVARPGQVVTAYIENLPEAASITMGWTYPPLPGAVAATDPAAVPPAVRVAAAVLPDGTTFEIESILIVRRAELGERWLAVSSTDGSFGTFYTSRSLLVVPRSTVADELVGRGG